MVASRTVLRTPASTHVVRCERCKLPVVSRHAILRVVRKNGQRGGCRRHCLAPAFPLLLSRQRALCSPPVLAPACAPWGVRERVKLNGRPHARIMKMKKFALGPCDNMTSFDTLYRFTSTSTSQPLTLPRPLGLVFARLRLMTSQVTDVR